MNKFLIAICYFVVSPVLASPLSLIYEVTSEEDPTVTTSFEKRTPTALRGVLAQNSKAVGAFMTSNPKQYRQTTWSYFTKNAANSGTGLELLFYKDILWRPYKPAPKSQDINRVNFVGLDQALFFSEQKISILIEDSSRQQQGSGRSQSHDWAIKS